MIDEHKQQKKLERRRRKREEKRRALSIESLPPLLLLPPIPLFGTTKMSVALKKVAEPLLEALPGGARRREVLHIMRLAMIAWNAAVSSSPEDLDRKLEELSLRILRAHKAARQNLLPLLQLLVERKQRLFPRDNRLVMDVEVREEKDEFRIVTLSRQ